MISLLQRRDHLNDADLAARVDGELRGGHIAAVERHLAACADCRSRLTSLQQTKALLASLPKPVPSRSFALTPALAGAQSGVRSAPRPRALVFAPLASLALLVALLGADFALVPSDHASPTTHTTAASQAQADLEVATDSVRKSAAPTSPSTSSGAGSAQSAPPPALAPPVPQTNVAPATTPPFAPQPSSPQPSGAPPIAPQAANPPPAPAPGGTTTGSTAVVPTARVVSGAFGSAAAPTPSARDATLSTAPPGPASSLAPAGESSTRRALRALEVVAALALVGSLSLLWRQRHAV